MTEGASGRYIRGMEQEPLHISQAFNLKVQEKELDFFDANLLYDSRLFIDPFLVKKSSLEEERELFERFGDFFRRAYDKSLEINSGNDAYQELRQLLDFHEPKEIGLGYTEKSNKGKGPGGGFANRLLKFFLDSSAAVLIKERGLYPDGRFNPVILKIFTDRLGPDGLSDVTANLIMDYLIAYTRKQCKLWSIPLTKDLPVDTDGFDFAKMEWKGGGYYELPENPLRRGQAIIFVPKRFLRASEAQSDNFKSRIKGILQQDPRLKSRFASLISKKLSEISIGEIRKAILKEKSILKRYILLLSREERQNYDFEKDEFGILAIKTYSSYFDDLTIKSDVSSCKEVLEHVMTFIEIFAEHMTDADGWKEMWADSQYIKPQKEVVFSRIFRGMGLAYFHHIPAITFESESGTGAGSVDFKVIFLDCIIVVEIKKLLASSPRGNPPIKAYLHGLKRQLPKYAKLARARHAIYITGQHYTQTHPNGSGKHHDKRVDEIESALSGVEKRLKKQIANFEELHYINLDFSPKQTASQL